MSIFPHLLRIWGRVIYKPFSTIKSEYPKFFEKCFQKTLEDGDFEINDKSQKGSIRRKMSVLENAI